MAKKISYKNCEFCSETVLATDLFCKHCNRDIGIDSSGINSYDQPDLNSSGKKRISKKSLILLIVGSVVVIDVIYYSFPSTFQSSNQSQSSSGTTSASICSKLAFFMEKSYKTASDFAAGSISASTARDQLSNLMRDVDNYRHSINDQLGSADWGTLNDFYNLLVSYPNNLYSASNSIASDPNMYIYWVDALNEDVDTKNQLCS